MFFDETIGNNSRFFGCFCVTRQASRNNCGHCQSDRTDWLLSAKDDRPWTEISWRLLTSRKSMWLSNQGKMLFANTERWLRSNRTVYDRLLHHWQHRILPTYAGVNGAHWSVHWSEMTRHDRFYNQHILHFWINVRNAQPCPHCVQWHASEVDPSIW